MLMADVLFMMQDVCLLIDRSVVYCPALTGFDTFIQYVPR